MTITETMRTACLQKMKVQQVSRSQGGMVCTVGMMSELHLQALMLLLLTAVCEAFWTLMFTRVRSVDVGKLGIAHRHHGTYAYGSRTCNPQCSACQSVKRTCE